MIIIWGKKDKREQVGSCRDWCPICRAASEFEVTRVWLVPHMYLVSVGKGELWHEEAKCCACGFEQFDEPGAFATGDTRTETAKNRLEERLQECLKRDSFERHGKHSKGERISLLVAPFVYIEAMHAKRFEVGVARSVISSLLVACFVLIIVVICLWYSYVGGTPREREATLPWAIGLSALGLLLGMIVLWYNFTQHRRQAVKYELPLAFRSVSVLRPTRAEMEEVLRVLKARKLEVVRGVTEGDFAALLDRP